MPKLAVSLLSAAVLFGAHASAATPSCPSATSLPGIVRATVDGHNALVGRVSVTYSFVEKSVCANFAADPKVAKTIEPSAICYDVSVYGRLTQRGDAAPTATMLDGSRRELRIDHESQLEMTMAYSAYSDDCQGLRTDSSKSAL
jgi:hypothetical protein